MNKESELILAEKYPKILRDYGGDMRQTCMAWGMECGDGWYKLLDEGMEKIQYFCDLCPSGIQLVADQIKEKYGTLRFYYHLENAENKVESSILDDIASDMERRSTSVCEITGEHGYLCSNHGWLTTLSYAEARKKGCSACDEGVEEYWKDLDKKSGKVSGSENLSSAS
jgi:hypothetical protein